MSDVTPTRSAVLELRDERRAMQEGYGFLDEKCLLLAAEIMRGLGRHESLQRAFLQSYAGAIAALRAALARHGLQGLQVHPGADLSEADTLVRARLLMGVRLQEAQLRVNERLPAAPVNPSPEASGCRRAFTDLLQQAMTLAAVSGNLERLYLEYRRAARRARALQEVLLPELERTLAEIEARLEELEQEDALGMRWKLAAVSQAQRIEE